MFFFGFFFLFYLLLNEPEAAFDEKDFSFVCILSEMKCLIIANKRSVNIVDHFFLYFFFSEFDIVFKVYSLWSLKTNKQHKK